VIDVSLDGYGSTDGDGYAAGCTRGTVPLTNLKYNTTAAQDFSAMTSLTDAAFTLTDFDLAAEITDGAASTNVGGTCTGHITVLVI
jgi:hypothetical protein